MAEVRTRISLKVGSNSNIPAEMLSFNGLASDKEHVALVFGQADTTQQVPLVRIHSECLTGDVFHSSRCDCGEQLDEAINQMAAEGGVILYLRQEGRGIGLLNKIRAYQLQDQGADTVEANEKLGFAADLRDYSICYGMLKHLNVQSLRLMTNNPRKVKALEEGGVNIEERLPLEVGRNPHNESYLSTKASKLGHWLKSHQDDM